MAVLSPLNRLLGTGARAGHALWIRTIHVHLRRLLFGGESVLEILPRLPMDLIPATLRELGAVIGARPCIKPGLRILAPHGDLSGLTIGDNVHFGSDVLLDLTAPITIGDDVAVGAWVNILTADQRFGAADDAEPRLVTIQDGALIATSVVILPGSTIGRNAVIAAQTLIERPVSPRTIVAGSPCRVVGNVTVA